MVHLCNTCIWVEESKRPKGRLYCSMVAVNVGGQKYAWLDQLPRDVEKCMFHYSYEEQEDMEKHPWKYCPFDKDSGPCDFCWVERYMDVNLCRSNRDGIPLSESQTQ